MGNVPSWIIAVSLLVIAAVLLGCAGAVTVSVVIEQQRREKMLRDEPWRYYIKPEYRFAPDAGNW